MTRSAFGVLPCLAALTFAASFLVACGDDDSDFIASPKKDSDKGEISSSSRKQDESSSSKKVFSSSSVQVLTLSDYPAEGEQDTSLAKYIHYVLTDRSSDFYHEPAFSTPGEQLNPDIEYGTMTDPRDGKTYRTVKAAGRTWMAENLNFADSVEYPLLEANTLCFDDNERYCELYGRLYDLTAAMYSVRCVPGDSCNLGDNVAVQGICPDGWHIPVTEDALVLEDLAESSAMELRSEEGWFGTSSYLSPGNDTYGLSFVGSGMYRQNRNDSEGEFSGFGEIAYIWIYGERSGLGYPPAYAVGAWSNKTKLTFMYDGDFLSVRCIKD